ncbi:MAG: ABC transporter ATP-binding protein [Planctomycetota bacterium]
MTAPILEVSNYSYAIGRKEILRRVSFEVGGGEFFSVIGPNGSGKTTLLRSLNRLLPKGSGSILLEGAPVERLSRRALARVMSYVPQAVGEVPPFTVREFVLMGRYPHLSPFSSPGREDRRAVERALALTGTAVFAERLVPTLSGGERQGVYIAAALAQGARVLLLDEPTTFLDPRHASEIRKVLLGLNRESGLTILSVTHDVNSAALLSHRVLALREGGVVFCGGPRALMTPETLAGIYGKEFLFVDHPETGQRVVVPEGVAA